MELIKKITTELLTNPYIVDNHRDILRNIKKFINLDLNNEQEKILNLNVDSILKETLNHSPYYYIGVNSRYQTLIGYILSDLNSNEDFFSVFKYLISKNNKPEDNLRLTTYLSGSYFNKSHSFKITEEEIISFLKENIINNVEEENKINYLRIILNSFFMENIKDDYGFIKPIKNEIEKVGIENLFCNLDVIFYKLNFLNLENSIKRYELLNKLFDINKLGFAFYKETSIYIDVDSFGTEEKKESYFDWSNYKSRQDLYNYFLDNGLDITKVDIDKVNKLIISQNKMRYMNNQYTYLYEKLIELKNYSLKDIGPFSLDDIKSLSNRNFNLPIIEVEIEDENYKKSIDDFINDIDLQPDKLINLFLNINFKDKELYVKYINEKFHEELLLIQKKCIENNDTLMLSALDSIYFVNNIPSGKIVKRKLF